MDLDTVLIIEDDSTLLRFLEDNFSFNGYYVYTAEDGNHGLQVILHDKPDLVILDIMIPGINGYDLCRHIRQDGITGPVIMLTAKVQESDIVLGLNLGADDYVTKPFSIDILLARANACLRRYRKSQPLSIEFGRFRLDMQAHKLFHHNRELFLTPKEYKLLDYFVHNAGRALTRDKILGAVWGEDLIVTQRSVDRCINTLRNKIETDPQHPHFIQTIRDVGYRFESS